MESIQEAIREWYFLLSQMSRWLSLPVRGLTAWAPFPFLTALLFGLVGALSPCQLTTNVSAMAYVSRKVGEPGIWWDTLAYTMAKILVYMFIGSIIILAGLSLQESAVPVAVEVRKAIGPLMIFVGLGLIGWIRLRGSFGEWFHCSLRPESAAGGSGGAFVLGVAFSVVFCPTLLWLYFGLMIPLALSNTGGWTFPALFALGTVLPLLVFAGLLSLGRQTSEGFLKLLKDSQRYVSRLSGAIFILAGVHDTLTYWLL